MYLPRTSTLKHEIVSHEIVWRASAPALFRPALLFPYAFPSFPGVDRGQRLLLGLFQRVQYGAGVRRRGQCGGGGVVPVRDMRAVPAQFFYQLDDLAAG